MEQKQINFSRNIYILIGFITVLLIGGIFYLIRSNFSDIVNSPDISENLNVPKGKIFLSLKPLASSSVINIYEFDLSSKKLIKFLTDDNIFSDDNDIALRFSIDTKKIVFISDRNGSGGQIFLANADGRHLKQITTNKNSLIKQTPVLSPDKNYIAFVAYQNKGLLPLPEERKIYISDLNGNERFITNGVNPIFSPDGKSLLVLKNSGIYIVDLQSNKEIVVAPLEKGKGKGFALVNMQFSISLKGDMLAWTNIQKKQIYVSKIASWKPLKYDFTKIFDIAGFWPVFSPDGNYLALEEVDWTPPNPTNPRLVIYDIKNGFVKQLVYNLNGHDQLSMWITDWR